MKRPRKICIDCKIQLGIQSAYKDVKRCNSCEMKRRHELGICNSHLSNLKDGRCLKKYYCKCGKEISYDSIRNNGTIQCQSCYLKTIKGKNHPMFGKHHSKESREKIKNSHIGLQVGEKNPNFNNWSSRKPYAIEWTSELRESIRKRDDYICQKCGMTEEEHLIVIGRILHVHHIDYDKENCNKNNLITLCLNCNIRANYNRSYWQKIYTNKIRGVDVCSLPKYNDKDRVKFK